MPSLLIRSPDGRTTSVDLSKRPVRLGRADTCDFVLRDDAEVSREHAEIWVDDDGRVKVLDKGSKNGTRVDDGEAFRNTVRPAYHSVRIGEHEIEVLGAAPPARAGRTPVTFMQDAPAEMGDTQFFPSTRRLDLSQQRLDLLIGLTERIGGVFDSKTLLEQALDACCEALGFERGLIALKTPRGETELPVSRNVQRDDTGAFKVSRSLINRALIQGERAIVNNPATDLVGSLTESLVRFPICSALCVPILNRGEILGVIYGDRITQASTYQPTDVDFLAAIAQQVGVGLANLRLLRDHVRSQRVYAELEQARGIQNKLLPDRPLNVGRIVVEGFNQPSSAVSGDYFDYFALERADRLGFIIADVTGHGLAAALLMANVQAAVRVALVPGVALTELASRVNRLICSNTDPHVFITGILGTIDARDGVIEYVSAGHAGPILVSRTRVTSRDDENSLPLGVDPDERFEVRTIRASEETDAVLFYTDGMNEAADRDGQILGLPPMLTAIQAMPRITTADLIRTCREVVRQHLDGVDAADDMTLLAVHLLPDAPSR